MNGTRVSQWKSKSKLAMAAVIVGALVVAPHAAADTSAAEEAQVKACETAIDKENLRALERCSNELVRIAPSSPRSHFFKMAHEAARGELGAARRELDRAHELGLPDDAYARFAARLDEARPWPLKVAGYAGWGFAIWAGILAMLFLSGIVLSRATMTRATASAASAEPRPVERKLRSLYGKVLGAACAFYYASLPLLALSVLGLGAAIIYAFFAMGRIPVKLVFIIGAIALVTAFVVLKSIFVRGKDNEPGDKLDLKANPRLREVLDEVAAKVGTRPVDTVYLTPGTDVAVFERGGVRKSMNGTAERCLVLGAGVLDGMDLLAFKGVLAHEYGHFKNEDTAGGAFSLAVRRSMLTMALGLAQQGMATWYNPAWHFVNQFHKVFLRISHGATRLQEILADRWAAFAYGSEAFERGLSHVVRRSVAFDVHVQRTISEVIERKLPLANLYRYTPEPKPDLEKEIDGVVEESLARAASEYDSHPPPNDRIAWVRKLGVKYESDDRHIDAWTLFANRAAIEDAMTSEVCTAVLVNHGVMIPAEQKSA